MYKYIYMNFLTLSVRMQEMARSFTFSETKQQKEERRSRGRE